MESFDVAVQDGDTEITLNVIAMNEADCRATVDAEGYTNYVPISRGPAQLSTAAQVQIVNTAGPTQLTKQADGTWLQTA